MELNLLLKSLSGGIVVTCPCCGHQFDYDAEPEHTFSQEVQDAAHEFISSIARGEAYRQIEQYRPEIQEAVSSIIDGMAGTKKQLIEAQKGLTVKGITDAFSFVRCPHCWSRVYRSNNILGGESETKEKKPEDEEEKPERGEETSEEGEKKPDKDDEDSKKKSDASFWSTLNAAITK